MTKSRFMKLLSIAQDAKDYPHSSYPYYAFGQADALIDEGPYYHGLGHTAEECQRSYREFVRLDGPYDRILDQSLTEAYF